MVESYLPYILLNEIQTMFSRKALDNIDLNRMSRRYVSGVLQNETSTSVHLIDRCENVNNVEKKSTSNMLIMEALNSPEIRKNTKATTVNKGQNFHC